MADAQFSKIFVFDINPGTNSITNELVVGKLAQVLKNICLYQHVVIVAHSNLSVLIKMVKDAGITNGFIISDQGARVYHIKSKKLIYDNAISDDNVQAIIHFGIMSDALVVLSGTNLEHAYSFNVLNSIDLNKKHYIPLDYSSDYQTFSRFAKSTNIYSAMVYFKNKDAVVNIAKFFQQISLDWDFKVHQPLSSFFVITNNCDSKHNAILKIMEHVNIPSNDNVFYYSLNEIDDYCMRLFKNSFVCHEYAPQTKFFTKMDSHFKVDALIHDLRERFFVGVIDEKSQANTTAIIDTKKLRTIMSDSETKKS
ncbi:MAG: HAD hydrolase family protein [Mycoplasmataceae bacterium]|jgi:hydroxymethylpyrimidine pyrophosphatase-like HAD family hydrolase|nr:HAD hydrolase family protein [Mycoplasmataceae bacterium]